MKTFILIGLLLVTGFFSGSSLRLSSVDGKNGDISGNYFPLTGNHTLIYKTSFGDEKSKLIYENGYYLFKNDGDKFTYYQKLLINESGVYVLSVYQKVHVFLFINSEANVHYNKPLLRIPFPVQAGKKWNWSGLEIKDNDTGTVNVSGKIIGIDSVSTPAGKFAAVKIKSLIVSSAGSKNEITEWFAKDIGMVKMQIAIQGGGVMGMLRNLLGYHNIDFELKKIISN